MRIGVDLMGSDSSPMLLFEGVQQAKKTVGSDVVFHLYATKDVVAFIKDQDLVVNEVPDFILMKENPLEAVRRKRNASLMCMMRDLADGTIDVAISAGSTGALITASTVLLPRLPGVRRPGLMAVLPSKGGGIAALDVGGFVEPRLEHLVQFARWGAAYQMIMKNVTTPRVALLNIGSEELKGTQRVQLLYSSLQQIHEKGQIEFVGNVEGRSVFESGIDVLVADGFTGNIFLKTVEGVSEYLLDQLHALLGDSQATDSIARFAKQTRYDAYAGALVAGMEGLVIKCHGRSTARAMSSAILGAVELYCCRLIPQLKDHFSSV